jgi:hypothetical protein
VADAEDVAKVRTYVAQQGSDCADGVSDAAIGALVDRARERLSASGKTRGWLGEVHGALQRRAKARE